MITPPAITSHPATKWWHPEGDRIVCTLCPRECRIGEGQRGFCFVRKNEGGVMMLTTHGRSTGFCVDPIEKKPLNHFLPGTPVLSFGTAGCNLGCKFCQNWDISKSREIEILSEEASPEAIVAAAKANGCRSIAFTYNDPVIWAEYAIDTAKIARAEGIKTVAVTAGYITPEARSDFFSHMDAANVDLKGFTDRFYRQLAFARLEPVLDTLKWLRRESHTWFEITTLLIPGENDSPEEIGRMSDWIAENLGDDIPLHFSAFHPDFKMRDLPATPHETLIQAREIATGRGLRYVYVGNVLDGDRQSTRCPGCGEIVIERDHYQLGQYRIHDGACASCGEKIPGVFENKRGDWGRRRLPIRIQPAPVPKPAPFDPDTRRQLLEHARHLVECAVLGVAPDRPLEAAIAAIPCHGLFVSLKRGHLLRGCIGNYRADRSAPISEFLADAAPAVATRDLRFPRVSAAELPFLTIVLTPLHGFRAIGVTGHARADAIEIGKHGLILARGSQRGLLLPQVATEQGYDATSFLGQVSLKAGLPADAWIDNDTELSVFEGEPFTSPPPQAEPDPSTLSQKSIQVLAWLASACLRRETGTVQVPASLATPSAALHGLILEIDGHRAVAIRAGAAIADLVREAAHSLADAQPNRGGPARIHLLSLPTTLDPADHPHRHRVALARGALLVRCGQRFGITLISSAEASHDPAASTLATLGLTLADWSTGDAQLISFQSRTIAFHPTPSDTAVRLPAFAGKFYPHDAASIAAQLDAHYSGHAENARSSARAIMLPHAGWIYCGDIIAETLSRVRIPEIVVIIGPKHTPHGANWSVSDASLWRMPGGDAPVATVWVDRLVALCPGLRKEADAHRGEHACEVLLPFLLRENPNLSVIPIAIGAAEFTDLFPLAQALASLRAELGERCLIVISSDLNHFANETETRRRDALALDRFSAADPRGLHDICMKEDISMCGLRPACAVLLALARESPVEVAITRHDTSARVSGDRDRVVGYAGAILR